MNTRRTGLLFTIVVLVTIAGALLLSSLSAAKNEADQFVYLPSVQKPWLPPQIIAFTANVEIANPGDTIELSWIAQNSLTTTLYHILPSGQFGSFWRVAPAGSMIYTISTGSRNYERFALYASNEDYPYASASLELPLVCPFTWFFQPAPDICPQDAALVSPGAEQTFERGWMIWAGGEGLIYVLYNDDVFSPKWDVFPDDWEEGDPINDPSITPPPGFYQPIRGFGLVWREQPNVRDRLGWAAAPETAYETTIQRTSYFRYNHIYIRAYDGSVWDLLPERSGWKKIVPTQ